MFHQAGFVTVEVLANGVVFESLSLYGCGEMTLTLVIS